MERTGKTSKGLRVVALSAISAFAAPLVFVSLIVMRKAERRLNVVNPTAMPDFQELRQHAHDIKKHTLDHLDYYLEEGKRSYQTVSELDVALYRPGFLMFEELSRSFENYSGALDYMRKCFFKPAPSQDPFAGFAEKIEGWVKLRLTPN